MNSHLRQPSGWKRFREAVEKYFPTYNHRKAIFRQVVRCPGVSLCMMIDDPAFDRNAVKRCDEVLACWDGVVR